MTRVHCSCCGDEIEWPPLDYGADAPWKHFGIPDEEFSQRVVLRRDDCVIDNEYFLVRGNVDIPIHGETRHFAWGVWVSVSRMSYERLCELWTSGGRSTDETFFAWLLTSLPCYPEPTCPVKSRLHHRDPGRVPLIEVIPDHPLGREQVEGITMERVLEFAHAILGPDAEARCSKHADQGSESEPGR